MGLRIRQKLSSLGPIFAFDDLSPTGCWAKGVTLITGLSGLYMLHAMHAWDRYLRIDLWWMHLMTLIRVIFSVVLFVLEPWFLHRWFRAQAVRDSEEALDSCIPCT